MGTPTGIDPAWWITAFELPALAGLFWLIVRVRNDADAAVDALRTAIETAAGQLRDGLAAHKLEVAKSYASMQTLREVERRLTDHLLRIEAKLDAERAALRGAGE